jgi:hypothetical protein
MNNSPPFSSALRAVLPCSTLDITQDSLGTNYLVEWSFAPSWRELLAPNNSPGKITTSSQPDEISSYRVQGISGPRNGAAAFRTMSSQSGPLIVAHGGISHQIKCPLCDGSSSIPSQVGLIGLQTVTSYRNDRVMHPAMRDQV